MNSKIALFNRPWSVKLGRSTKTLRVRVPPQVENDARVVATALGVNVSTLMREMLLVRVYGPDKAKSMQTNSESFVGQKLPAEQESNEEA